MGRSPRLVTAMATDSRPSLSVISPGAAITSPGTGASPAPAKRARSGTGRKLPWSASARSPCSSATGWCTVTSLVPSANVPSTCTSAIISGTPSITSARPSRRRPRSISSATLLPSRMNSSNCAAMSPTASGWFRRSPRASRFCARKPTPWSSSLSISRGIRCMQGLVCGGRGSWPARPGVVAEESAAVQVVGLLDAIRARSQRQRPDPPRERGALVAQGVPGEQQRAERIESAEALGERAVGGVEEEALRDEEPVSAAQGQLAFIAAERPPLAPRAPPGREHIHRDGRGAPGEPKLRLLLVRGAGEAHGGVRQEREEGPLADLGGELAPAPAHRAIDAVLSLRRQHGGCARSYVDSQPDGVAIDHPAAQRAGVRPGGASVVARREDAQGAGRERRPDDGPGPRAAEREPGLGGPLRSLLREDPHRTPLPSHRQVVPHPFGIQIRDLAAIDHLPAREDRIVLRERLGEIDVLLDQQDGHPPLEQDPEHALDVLHDGRLDPLGGLVEQEQLGAGDQRARDGELLLLAPGEVAPAPLLHCAQ